MKIVLIDNYDSFTYNLVQYFEEIKGIDLIMMKNDQINQGLIKEAHKLVISPGPGIPSESGSIISLIQTYTGIKPILGVCLGLQAIYESFGGKLLNPERVFHGVTSVVTITKPGDPFFKEISNPFVAGRYHSWVCDPANIPNELEILAWDEEKEVMACKHRTHLTYGVQFHPESFLTPEGKKLIRNFVELQ
ncbi:MAG: aminodeoxychorismate/anthranilate synthase component II [Saprospiraceae bacterium]